MQRNTTDPAPSLTCGCLAIMHDYLRIWYSGVEIHCQRECMMTTQRPWFECWKCKRRFGQVVDLEGEPLLLLECPYCGAQCKVDLALLDRQRIISVSRAVRDASPTRQIELADALPTSSPEQPLSEPASEPPSEPASEPTPNPTTRAGKA